jgi:hypothetical protein
MTESVTELESENSDWEQQFGPAQAQPDCFCDTIVLNLRRKLKSVEKMFRSAVLLACLASASAFAPSALLPNAASRG